MRAIKNAYTYLTSKDSYIYPEPSSMLISMMSTELSALKNLEKQTKNIQGSDENIPKNRSKSKSPVMNIKTQDQNTGYSSYFGYERVFIRGDNDYYRWLQDYAKRDMFTDWVETAFGKCVGR
ncbi:hypothetical protein PMAC_000372 [Pneumocystis sp. 'macacae']|nr:hypothetical protein PMAC_000372 [Pneumocystis sp. 'macacae']